MWVFSGRGFLGRAPPLFHRQIVVSQAPALSILPGGLQATSPLELSLACSMYFGDKGDRTMAFLSALDEDHRRWDMIEDCEL
jgi:hypothetical protein